MKTFPFSLIVVAILVTACGSRKEPTPTPANTDTPLPPTATPIVQMPNGTYKVSISKDELTATGMAESVACENAGVLALITAGDQWSIIQTAAPGCTVYNPKWSGTWKFTGDQVTFHDETNIGCPADYTYKWSYNGSALHFTSIDDTGCAPRVYYMSTHPWVREK